MRTHRVGVIGPQGKGLGYRFALAGHEVLLGSRSAERAVTAAAELNARLPEGRGVTGTDNVKAAEAGDVVLLAVPYDGHGDLVASLRGPLTGKTVISCVNPLAFDRRGPYGVPVPEGSAAEQAAALLPGSVVVGAFHHVSAVALLATDEPLSHEDVLVCADDAGAGAAVRELAAAVTGRPGVDVGPLRLARQLEPLTAVLISINKRYRTQSGIAISGL